LEINITDVLMFWCSPGIKGIYRTFHAKNKQINYLMKKLHKIILKSKLIIYD